MRRSLLTGLVVLTSLTLGAQCFGGAPRVKKSKQAPRVDAGTSSRGADLLVVLGDDDQQVRSRAKFATGALARLGRTHVPLLLLGTADVTDQAALELTDASKVLRAANGLEEQLFPSLKLGLKLALEEMKKPQPQPSEPLSPAEPVNDFETARVRV